MNINLTKPEHAYLYGFLLADGNFYETTRNRGRVSIEISEKDKHILELFGKSLPYNYSIKSRTRDTNLKPNYTSTTIRWSSLKFRNELKLLGLTPGAKSKIVTIPDTKYSERDLWRGIIDGDGSLGISKEGRPFVSLFTMSSDLKNSYLELIKNVTGRVKIINKNKRDNGYNIVLLFEDAQELVRYLYYKDCICLDRKLKISREILKWSRPKNNKRHIKTAWTSSEDQVVMSNSIKDASVKLNRSKSSVANRRFRLRKQIVTD